MAKQAPIIPSAWQQAEAVQTLLAVREQLLAIDPTILQDETLLADMLEGEGGDAMAILDRMIRRSLEVAAFVEAIQARKRDLTERQQRFERGADVLRQGVANTLSVLGLTKLERPDFTVALRDGSPKVIVTNESQLPPQFVRVERHVELRAIGKALRGGADVPGAELGGNSPPVLTVRTT